MPGAPPTPIFRIPEPQGPHTLARVDLVIIAETNDDVEALTVRCIVHGLPYPCDFALFPSAVGIVGVHQVLLRVRGGRWHTHTHTHTAYHGATLGAWIGTLEPRIVPAHKNPRASTHRSLLRYGQQQPSKRMMHPVCCSTTGLQPETNTPTAPFMVHPLIRSLRMPERRASAHEAEKMARQWPNKTIGPFLEQ